MNDEIKKLMQNLMDAQNALAENRQLLQQKSMKEAEMQKAILDANAAIRQKSEQALSDLDHEILRIQRDYHKKIQSVLTASKKIQTGMNELTRQLAKIDDIIDKMNRSDAKHEKAMHYAAFASRLINRKYIKPFAYPYYESYCRNRTQRHDDEISALNRQKEEVMAKMQLNHADAILKIDEYRQKLQEYDSQIWELNQEKDKQIRAVELKKREMANWHKISAEELQARAIEKITSEYKNETDPIDAKINENNLFLKNECRVGPEYQNDEALTKLISYFRNERAGTIKEALELYLQEERYEEEKRARIYFQNKQLQLQKRHLEELNRKLEILAEKERTSGDKAQRH